MTGFSVIAPEHGAGYGPAFDVNVYRSPESAVWIAEADALPLATVGRAAIFALTSHTMDTFELTPKGQLTLSDELMRHLGVGPGDRLHVEKLSGGRVRFFKEERAAPSRDSGGQSGD